MNIFETYDPKDGQNYCRQAAEFYIESGFQVVPLKAGEKTFSHTIQKLQQIRNHPINIKNVGFYFGEEEEIAIILDEKTEVIDIDEKNDKGIAQRFMDGLIQQNPDLYDKLVVVKTSSGGLHLWYHSYVVGGEQAMAKKLANPQPVVTIEKLSHPRYVKAVPSKGYEYIKGTIEDIQYLMPEEREWLVSYARSYNELITYEKVRKHDVKRKDSPWTVFNEKNNYQYILDQLKNRNWKEVMRHDDRINMKRPGNSSQRSSGSILIQSNTLFLFTTSTELPAGKHLSPYDIYTHFYHDGDYSAAARTLAEHGVGKLSHDEGEFWISNGKGIEVKYEALREYLHSIGIRRHQDDYLVQVVHNRVHIMTTKDLHRLLINVVEEEVRDKFYKLVKSIFDTQSGLYSMIDDLEDNFVRDDANNIWLFFRNRAININANEIIPTNYSDMPGLIWAEKFINHDFHIAEWEGCDADRFFELLGGENKLRLMQVTGYAISEYKDVVNPKCVLITEDIPVEDEGESHGGSGKSLLVEFIKKLRKVVQIDGKNINMQNQFMFQNVNPDTSIIYIDDVSKHFKIESWFSMITGEMQINKKYKEEISIPFSRSPKIVISSNYAIGNSDESTKRRVINFPVVKHFSADHTPIDEFGRAFFSEWDEEEWNRYFNFMCECSRVFLAGDKRLKDENERYSERSLINETSSDFVQYMDNLLESNFLPYMPQELKTLRYTDEHGNLHTNAVDMSKYDPEVHKVVVEKSQFLNNIKEKTGLNKIAMTTLSVWIKKWSRIRNVEIDVRFRVGREQKLYYRFVRWNFKSVIEKCTTEPERTTSYNNSSNWTPVEVVKSENDDLFW